MKEIKKMLIRQATLNDIPGLIHLENAQWVEAQRCTAEKFVARLHYFPAGFLIALANNKIIASFYAIKYAHTPGMPINWLRDSGQGTGNTHDEKANSLFSVSITVSHAAPKGTYRRMIQAWRHLAREQKVNCIYAGSRIPGLAKFSGSPPAYLAKVKRNEHFDPILSKAKCCGFTIGNLIPNYFPDPESLHYGVEIFQWIT